MPAMAGGKSELTADCDTFVLFLISMQRSAFEVSVPQLGAISSNYGEKTPELWQF